MNYQIEMEKVLERVNGLSPAPSLLLHSCCAPCSSYVLETLSRYFQIVVYFYNPNMNSQQEFARRAEEQLRLIEQLPSPHPVRGIIVPFDSREFYSRIKGLEQELEGGARCEKCFALRLEHTAHFAAQHHFDWFTTTLTISPLKNAALLNQIGQAAGERWGVPFLPSDFKKKGGFLRSTQLSKEYELYRQNYCGCVFSMNQRT